MPIFQFKDFEDCVNHYQNKGKSKEEAQRICGALEQRAREERKKKEEAKKFFDIISD